MYQRLAKISTSVFPLILVALTFTPSLAQDLGAPDTVRVGTVTGTPGSKIVLSVTGFNDEDLAGIQTPLKLPSSFLTIDSVSYVGSRLTGASINYGTVSIDNINKKVNFGAIYFGSPLTSGDGLFARIYLSVSPSAVAETVTVDTFYDPPAVLNFVDPNGFDWLPQFKPGKIIIQLENPAPVWQLIGNQSVSEGDSLKILLRAKDPAGEPLTFAALNGPPGSVLSQVSDSTAYFSWVPAFVGPYSSSGSPFKVTFVVSDGVNFIRQDVTIFVINKNALPTVTAPDTIISPANVGINFQVSATDQDQESIALTALNLPLGAGFDNQNPGMFDWTPAENQVGTYGVLFEATDASGGKDTATAVLIITPAQNFILSLPDMEGFSGEIVTMPLNLVNKDSIGGCQLLLHYDPSALILKSVSRTGTRTEGWESFNVVIDPGGNLGDVRIVGIANLPNQTTTPPLAPGQGPIVNLTFQISENQSLPGFSIPVIFKSTDPLDNTLSDGLGNLIGQSLITYKNGSVYIKQLDVLLGDINLNGFAFDIGDAVRFANYFINPVAFALNAQQIANSDVNGDALPASIADLVFLIRRIVEGPTVSGTPVFTNATSNSQAAEIQLQRESDATVINLNSINGVGGLHFVFEHGPYRRITPQFSARLNDYDVWYKDENGLLRILIFSFNARTLPGGNWELFRLNDSNIKLKDVSASDGAGYVLSVGQREVNSAQASSIELEQNYPNPFNQETKIAFYLALPAKVKLEVFNIRGQRVRQLLDQDLNSGRHQINWDGKNESGESVATGIYLYRLVAGKESLTKKLTFIK